MGFIKKLFSFGAISKAQSFLEDKKDKPREKAEPEGKSEEQKDKERKAKLIATNAGKDTGFNPLSNEPSSVTKKSLLGL